MGTWKGLSRVNRSAAARELRYIRKVVRQMVPDWPVQRRNAWALADLAAMLRSNRNWVYGRVEGIDG